MDPTVTEKVCAIRDSLVELIGASRYGTWFGEATHLAFEGERLDVTVSNAFVGNWISANYLPQLVEAARKVMGVEPRVVVRVAESGGMRTGPAAPPTHPGPRGTPARPPALSAAPSRRDGRPTLRGELAGFVVGPCNELAFSVISAVARAPGQAFKHVVVHGGCGLGKTHLLQGVCNAVSRTHPALEWQYLSGEEFTNQFICAFRAGGLDRFRARFRNVDLLVIDDIHFLANKKSTQEEFLHTFNAIDACGKTVVTSSNNHPRRIDALAAPLVDRLIAATLVEVYQPDYTTRREILRRRAATMLCELGDDLLDYLAQRVTRNVRELEGALYKLSAYAALTKEPLTLELARRVVADTVPEGRTPEASEIERVVTAYFGVTREALRSSSRDRTVTQARAIAFYLLRKHTSLSFPEIGRLMGNKQHSTVLMAVRRVQQLLDHGGAAAWKTSSGLREVPARELVEELERRLSHRRDA